jgi:hypothetical protein
VAVDFSKTILNAVRAFVRGLIADTLAKLVSILFRYVPPAYPIAMAAEGLPLIMQNTMAGTKMARNMIDAFGRLGEHLGRLGELLVQAAKHLNRGVHAADIVLRHRGSAAKELFSGADVLTRAGVEGLKEGIKYLGPRVANATVAGVTQSTDPNGQVDLTETTAKRQRDHDETRVDETGSTQGKDGS